MPRDPAVPKQAAVPKAAVPKAAAAAVPTDPAAAAAESKAAAIDEVLEAILVRIITTCYEQEIQQLLEVGNPQGQLGLISIPTMAKLTTGTIAQHSKFIESLIDLNMDEHLNRNVMVYVNAMSIVDKSYQRTPHWKGFINAKIC